MRLHKVRQRLDRTRLDDPRAALRPQLAALDWLIRPGAHIAIAAGSRGIDNLALVVREVSDYLKARGAMPFVVPAMGSHGGATAEGQAEILQSYGISESTIGAPVRSSMDAVEVAGAGLADSGLHGSPRSRRGRRDPHQPHQAAHRLSTDDMKAG